MGDDSAPRGDDEAFDEFGSRPTEPPNPWTDDELHDGLVDHHGLRNTVRVLDPDALIAFADINGAFDGEIDRSPTVLARGRGDYMLYPGTVNLFAGAPGSLKTTLACIAASGLMNAGANVGIVDAEDTLRRVVARMLAVGARPDAIRSHLIYLPYEALVTGTEAKIAVLGEVGRQAPVDLFVFDGVAEALAAHKLDEDRSGDYARWHGTVPRPLARASDAAVLLLDHVPKPVQSRSSRSAASEPDLYPRGSGHKLAAIDGAAYMLTLVEPLSRQTRGIVDLTIAKDRAGHVGGRRTKAARVLVEPKDDGLRLDWRIERPLDLRGLNDDGATAGLYLAPPFLDAVVDAITEIADNLRAAPNARRPSQRGIAAVLRSHEQRFDDKKLAAALVKLQRDGRIEREEGRNGPLYGLTPEQRTLDDAEPLEDRGGAVEAR